MGGGGGGAWVTPQAGPDKRPPKRPDLHNRASHDTPGGRGSWQPQNQAADGIAPKRPRLHPLLVKAEGGGDGIHGLEVLLGRYELRGRRHAGQPVWEKVEGSYGASGNGEPCFLYYWGPEEGEDDEGWWFGDEVGGAMVYCYARKTGFPPPMVGWRIPAEDHPKIECLRVVPQESTAAAVRGAVPEAANSTAGHQTRAAGPGSLRFTFAEGSSASLGIHLSSDFPPVINAVAPGSAAALQGVPVGGTIQVINGRTLSRDGDYGLHRAMRDLTLRPLVLDILPEQGAVGAATPEETHPLRSNGAPSSPATGRPVTPPQRTTARAQAVAFTRPSCEYPATAPAAAFSMGVPSPGPAGPRPPGTPPPARLMPRPLPRPPPAPMVRPPPQPPQPVAAKATHVAHVSISVPEGAPRRAALLAAAFADEEAECIEHLLLKVLRERVDGPGRRLLWAKVQELAS